MIILIKLKINRINLVDVYTVFYFSQTYAESELIKASAEMSRTAKGLSEQTEFFERRKLQQLKSLLSNFITIEMTFHAKAVELFTVAYQQISDINDKADLEVTIHSYIF